MTSATVFRCFLLAFCVNQGFTQPTVKISNGDIMGSELLSYGGRTYYAFRGIPFAQPPVGPLRFQPPQPAKNWTGVLKAISNGNVCIQFGLEIITDTTIVGSEDCLYLYVYTPKLPSNNTKLLPVLLFVHGGSFAYGSAQFEYYRPDFIMDQNVVLVVIQYRLGPLGFLSTGDEVSSGNYGMLDQVMAMKWTQKNIGAFGGDKDKVTIFGESAGAAAVLYHPLSPASKGLFRGVIAESGTPLVYWALQENPKLTTQRLAKALNCSTVSSSVMVDCISQQSAKAIIIGAKKITDDSLSQVTFVPSLEDPKYGRFLTQTPETIVKSGNFTKVPIITGINQDESAMDYDYIKPFYTFDKKFYDTFLPDFIRNITGYDKNLLNVSYAIKKQYFNNLDVNNSTQVVDASIKFASDVYYIYPCAATVKLLAKNKVPVYMYSFDYEGSFFYYFSGQHIVGHADELKYLFYNPPLVYSAEDLRVSKQLISMWINFAENLNPNSKGNNVWLPTPFEKNLDYLKITEQVKLAQDFLAQRMNFWEETVPAIVK